MKTQEENIQNSTIVYQNLLKIIIDPNLNINNIETNKENYSGSLKIPENMRNNNKKYEDLISQAKNIIDHEPFARNDYNNPIVKYNKQKGKDISFETRVALRYKEAENLVKVIDKALVNMLKQEQKVQNIPSFHNLPNSSTLFSKQEPDNQEINNVLESIKTEIEKVISNRNSEINATIDRHQTSLNSMKLNNEATKNKREAKCIGKQLNDLEKGLKGTSTLGKEIKEKIKPLYKDIAKIENSRFYRVKKFIRKVLSSKNFEKNKEFNGKDKQKTRSEERSSLEFYQSKKQSITYNDPIIPPKTRASKIKSKSGQTIKNILERKSSKKTEKQKNNHRN